MKVRSFLVGSSVRYYNNGVLEDGTVLFKWRTSSDWMVSIKSCTGAILNLPINKCLLINFKLDGKLYNSLGEEIA